MDIQTEKKTKKRFEKRDIQKVVSVAWPSALESFFVALAGIVDTYMVSNLNSAAVAAVGLTTQPKFIGLAPFLALKIAISALVARRFGQKDRDKANSIMMMGLIFTVVGSIIVSILCVMYAEPIMRFVGSQPDTHEYAVTYFRIIMGGMIFNSIQLAINAAQRGVGNTKIAMRTNVTANVVNVIGNYLLIEGHLGFPALGVAGAAIATVFGTAVACLMSILSVLKKESFVSLIYAVKKRIGFAADQLGSMGKLFGSELMEQFLVRIGFLLTAMFAADMGTDAFAAHQVGMNLMSLTFALGDGFSVAAVALIGKSLGEEKPEMAKTYAGICHRFALCLSAVMSVIFLLGGRTIFSLFFAEEVIIEYGVMIARMLIVICLFQMSQVVFTGCLRGAGDMVYVMVIGCISVAVLRPASAYLLAYVCELGLLGVWCGIMVDQGARLLGTYLRYRSGKWTKIKI
ncbi:MAG: MATE family efflux transporter [Lachnospiraceae bacterium]|nr:MATE family efflux transporter [Lachnospiraceae bacterium]